MTDYNSYNSYSNAEASRFLAYILSQLEPIKGRDAAGAEIDAMKEAHARIDAIEARLESQRDHSYLLESSPCKSKVYSHLGAILGYNVNLNGDGPRRARAEMAWALFESVLNKAETAQGDNPEPVRDLLRYQTFEDTNLLHMVVNHPSLGLVKSVFAKIQEHTPPEEYSELLGNHNQDKATVLSNAIRSKDWEVVDFVFKQVKEHVPKDRYKEMLAITRDYNTTLLQSAVKSGDAAIAALVFKELEENLTTGQMQAMMKIKTNNGEHSQNLMNVIGGNEEMRKLVTDKFTQFFGATAGREMDLLERAPDATGKPKRKDIAKT